MMVRIQSNWNTFLLVVGLQTYTATIEITISVVVPQEAGNSSTTRSSYTNLGHLPKGLYILLQSELLVHVHCCSVHTARY